MADETRVTGSSLTSFDDAARTVFAMVRGDPDAEGLKAAERGAYASFAGSKWDRGLLPHDTLELVVEEAEISNPVVTSYDVRFSEETETRYDSVSIQPDGRSDLEIQIVS